MPFYSVGHLQQQKQKKERKGGDGGREEEKRKHRCRNVQKDISGLEMASVLMNLAIYTRPTKYWA